MSGGTTGNLGHHDSDQYTKDDAAYAESGGTMRSEGHFDYSERRLIHEQEHAGVGRRGGQNTM